MTAPWSTPDTFRYRGYLATMHRLRSLRPHIVHGGHFPSFGATRFTQLIDAYVAEKTGAT